MSDLLDSGAVITTNGHGGRSRAAVPIGTVRWRQRARVRGRVRSMRVQPWADVASLECVIVDDTGGLVIVFLGRRKVAGIDLGRYLVADGVVGAHRGYLAMLNPEIDLEAPDQPSAPRAKRRWRRKR